MAAVPGSTGEAIPHTVGAPQTSSARSHVPRYQVTRLQQRGQAID